MSAHNEEAEEQKNLGNEEFNLKNFDKAVEYYSEAIRLDPENHVYYSNRSAAYGAVGNWEQAEADAQECVKRNPQFAKGYHRLANAQKQLGRNAEAIATLRAAQANAADAGKNPGIKKLLRDLNQEASPASAQAGTVTGPGGRALPPHVAKELQELQPQFMNIQREVEQIDAKLANFARQKKRVALVEKEIEELPEGTTTYQSVGKMFLQTTKTENFASMKDEARKVDDQVSSLEARKNYLNRQKTSLEENITELLAQSNM
ncbi:Heat shock protein sti1 [Globisporangium polare]